MKTYLPKQTDGLVMHSRMLSFVLSVAAGSGKEIVSVRTRGLGEKTYCIKSSGIDSRDLVEDVSRWSVRNTVSTRGLRAFAACVDNALGSDRYGAEKTIRCGESRAREELEGEPITDAGRNRRYPMPSCSSADRLLHIRRDIVCRSFPECE